MTFIKNSDRIKIAALQLFFLCRKDISDRWGLTCMRCRAKHQSGLRISALTVRVVSKTR